VLIAEDEFISRSLLEAMIQEWNYGVVSVTDGDAAWETLQSPDAPSLIILDWVMPGKSGLDICHMIRNNQKEEYAYKYIILLTGKETKEDIVRGLEAGADDYITKPFDAHELRMRLRAGRRIIELHDKLRYYATYDPLTGLLNRRFLFDRLNKEIARAKRENSPLSIGLLDLDHFKSVNDAWGHLAGDKVLCEAARRIRSCLREYDVIGRYRENSVVGRYGGEEFLIVALGVGSSQAMNTFERIRACISEQSIDVSGDIVSITASIGVATVEEGVLTTDLTSLIKAADTQLYQAKLEGRDRVKCITVY
jgi:diguanylate cyclase (GGDEF)-like protein